MGATNNNLDIVRKFSENLNNGDFDAADEYLTDDYTHHNYKDTYHGKEAFRETMTELRSYFPDAETRLEDSVVAVFKDNRRRIPPDFHTGADFDQFFK